MDTEHREFLLSALRTACLRCKAMESDLGSIGIALKADLISPDTAVQWIEDAGLMFLVQPLPATVGLLAKQGGGP